MTKKGMKKGIAVTTIILMFSNFLVKFFGLTREILLAGYYGTSLYTDAYVIANSMPTVLFSAIGTSIATTFVPMYSRIVETENEQRANTFTIHLIEILLIICSVFTICGEIFIRQFVFLFASGFTGELFSLTIHFARILLPSIFGLALMNVLGAYLQQHGSFVPIALVPVFGNGVIIIALILSQRLNDVFILVWGTLLGIIVQVFFYIPWVIRTGIFRTLKLRMTADRYLGELLKLVVPVFLGEAVNEVNAIIDKSLVSGLGMGGVSALNYANKIISLVTGVFIVSISSILFPKISRQAAEGKKSELKITVSQVLIGIFLLMLPIMTDVIVFRWEIVRILFQRGSFDEESVRLTSGALGFYAVGLVAVGMRDVLVKLFYSLQNTKIPMLNGAICAIANIFLDIILIHLFGIFGAALATTLVAVIGCLNLLSIAVKKNLIGFHGMIKPVIKGVSGCFIMLIFILSAKKLADKYMVDIRLHMSAYVVIGIGGLGIFSVSQIVMKNFYFLKNHTNM